MTNFLASIQEDIRDFKEEYPDLADQFEGTERRIAEFIGKEVNHGEMVSALTRLAEKTRRVNGIQHSGGRISNEDWSELYAITNEAFAILARTEGGAK